MHTLCLHLRACALVCVCVLAHTLPHFLLLTPPVPRKTNHIAMALAARITAPATPMNAQGQALSGTPPPHAPFAMQGQPQGHGLHCPHHRAGGLQLPPDAAAAGGAGVGAPAHARDANSR